MIVSLCNSKGTRFKVCGVYVKTSFGSELCAQYILANLLDEYGQSLPTQDFFGNIVSVNVGYLFENTFEMPNENWIFRPRSQFIREITD